MIAGQVVTMFVGADRRTLAWTPDLAAHWATVARQALSIVSVTPTPAPMLWVDGSTHPGLEEMVRLSLQSATWEATCRWLALLTADCQLADTFLCLEITRPTVYPVVLHFHLVRHCALLTYLAGGGAFHLALDPAGQVLPFLSVSSRGLGEQLALAEAFRRLAANLRAPP